MENKTSRRHFLKASSLATAGVASSGLLSSQTLLARVESKQREHHPHVIIGSGFGGSITALRLTERGKPALIIEKGNFWDTSEGNNAFSPNLYPDGRSTWLSHFTVVPLGPSLPIRKRTGVLQGRTMGGLTLLSGAAYGGGSVTYGGVMVKPDQGVFDALYPKEIRFHSLKTYYDRVAAMLGRSIPPEDVLSHPNYKHVKVMKEHCRLAGIEYESIPTATRWDVVRREMAEKKYSILNGEAIYGVNSGAKVTMVETYLKKAKETGLLETKTHRRVLSIGYLKEEGKYLIKTEKINSAGRIEAKQEITCDKLFLCAGSIGTSSLLVKAKTLGTLSQLNDEVGRGFGNNGNVYALRLIEEATGRMQAGPPAVGIRDVDNPISPLFIEHPQLPVGLDLRALLYFGIGVNPTRGSYYYDVGAKKVKLRWPKVDEGQNKVNQAFLATLSKLNEKAGGSTSSILTAFRSKVKDNAVYHPLGGCVMGKACDFYGRVKGYKGLYVNDSSFLPGTSACTNPSFTISALAERNIETILKRDFSRYF